MKKLFDGNLLNKRKVLNFLDKKGFYVVLLLCVGIITITAYTVTKRNLSSYMENADLGQLTPPVTKPDARLALTGPDKATKSTTDTTVKPTEKKSSESQNKTVTSSKTPARTTAPVSKPAVAVVKVVSMTSPILGSVVQEYAKTSLVYSKTLDEWTTHMGLDYAADIGIPVKAALDGTVSEVYQDIMYGSTIILEHGNGLKTKYANLSTDSLVKKGDRVKKGSQISKVGNTSIAESSEQPHLHFEVLQNGVSVNPRDFIKQ